MFNNLWAKLKSSGAPEEWLSALAVLATWCVLLATVTDTVSRYMLKHPLSYAMDLGEMLMVVIVFLALASVNRAKGHIRVTVLARRFTQGVQDSVSVITSMAGIFIYGFIGWRAWIWTVEAWKGSYTYGGLVEFQIPECIPYGTIAFGSFIFCWSLLLDAVSSVRNLASSRMKKGDRF